MRAALALALLLAAGAARADEAVDPDAPSLRVLVRKGGAVALAPKVKVGEPFHVVITATARPGVLVNLPATFDAGSFEVLERKEATSPDGAERSFDLTVVAWKPGQESLPAVPVTYVGQGKGEIKQVTTAALAVEVTPVLEDPERAELRPIAPPVAVYVKDWTLVYIGAGLAAVLVVGGVGMLIGRAIARRRRRARPAPVVVDTRAAHEIALERLRALEQSGALDQVDRRPFYFAVTEIVRDFLGRRFGFDALDMTSTELMAALGASPAAPEVRDDVERWLGSCDLVKYARVSADRTEAATAFGAAVALVDAAKAPPPIEGTNAG